MFRTRSRLRRLLLGAAVATCSLAGIYGGSASATLNLDTSSDGHLDIDGDVHSFQGNLRPITVGGYQYFAYWDAVDPVDGEVYLMLSRRRLSDDNVVTLRFDGGDTGDSGAPRVLDVPMDGHNYVGLGISPNDGRIHMSWSLHDDDRKHRYMHSEPGCISQTQTNFTFANCDFSFTIGGQTGESVERLLTYPTYFNDSRGRLYMAWRYDASARGDQYLNEYNDDGTWTPRGTVMRGRKARDICTDNNRDGDIEDRGECVHDPTYDFTYDVDGAGGRGTITTIERGVYIQEWEFDSRDRLHALWIWKENDDPLVWRHGLNYAYSDDFGETWYYENNGRTGLIADLSRAEPITILDLAETEVVSVPPGWDISSAGFELDSNGNPHMVVAANSAQQPDDLARYHLQTHFWRTTDKAWHSDNIETTGDVRQGMTALPGEIFFDRADNAYAIFARNGVDWYPYNRRVYVQAELPYENVTWQPRDSRTGYLDVQLHSATTCLQTSDNIATSIDTTNNKTVRVNMANDTRATTATVSWIREGDADWSSGQLQTFNLPGRDTSYRTYEFTITDADWSGTLRNLEICTAEGVSSGDQQIDWIDIYNPTTRRSAKTWGFDAPIELYAGEASQADNWGTWNVEPLFAGDSVWVTPTDGYFFVDTQRYIDSGWVSFNIHQQGDPGTEILSLREFGLTRDDIIKDWRFDTDTQGWTAYNNRHVTGFAWTDDTAGRAKGIGGTLAGRDPALLSAEALDVNITNGDWLHIVMKNDSSARLARVWFRTAADRTWTSGKSVQFAINARSGYTEYDIDMSGVSGWDRSLLYQLEIDPSDDDTLRDGFVIDRIYINDTR